MKKMNLSYVYLLLLILSIGILGFSTVSCVAAAEPSIKSKDQSSVMNMKIMGVSVLKDGETVSSIVYDGEGNWERTVDTGKIFGDDASLKVGETIDASFTIANDGSEDERINVYTRVIIYKYWKDENGKDFQADPSKIHIMLKNVSGNINSDLGWYLTSESDEPQSGTWLLDSQTNEKIILYYDSLLEPGDVSAVFMEGMQLDNSIKKDYETVYVDEDHTIIAYDYAYNGKSFVVEVEVDAVQDHSAEEAIKAAWGRNVTVSDGKLALN